MNKKNVIDKLKVFYYQKPQDMKNRSMIIKVNQNIWVNNYQNWEFNMKGWSKDISN
jgi:hypothetical protein